MRQLDHLLRDERAHAVVDAPAGEDDLRLVADSCSARGRQVVRVDADAVAAHQARGEAEEVPLGAGGVEHVAACGCRSGRRSCASSFMSAMLRSRCVFSITLAASATLMRRGPVHARRHDRP